MAGNSLVGTTSRQLTVFLCHDLRDKQNTINTSDQPEKGIVLQLSEWLEARDINVWRSDKELAGGETWKREIYEKAIPTCDLFVVCLTKNFVDNTPGQRHREVIRALEIAETKHPDTTFILPIRIDQVRYPGLEEKQYINYYKHPNFDIILSSLVKKSNQIENQGHTSEQATPSQDNLSLSSQRGSTGVWNIPYRRNIHFTGRDDLLDRLEQHLSPADQGDLGITRRAALTQTQAIKGLGGIGKTQVAVEYAYRSLELDRYTHTLWVNAASEEALITSFTALAELLPEFPGKDETDQNKLVGEIKRWLEQCENRWLLIFDNADDVPIIQEYLPQWGKGSILITTRANAVGSLAPSLEVEKMNLMEGAHLLLRRAQRFESVSDEEINEASNIVVALDHFPLALDQAGAYIEESRLSFDGYLQVYLNRRKEVLARRGTQATNYPDSVATTWSLSFQKIEQGNPAAAELLRLLAFLAPDAIPEELIRDGADHWSPLLQQAIVNIFTFNQMIEELLKFSLIQRLVETQMLSIHRLVQAVQMDMVEPEAQHQWAKRVVQALNEVFPRPQDIATWPQCLRYLGQAQACGTLIERYMLSFTEAADLLNRIGFYLSEHALYTIAEQIYQHALSIDEQQLGTDHPGTAISLNNLAELYQTQGKYMEAEQLYQRALSINEQQLGADHSGTATSLNNLAELYRVQGRYGEAEPLYQRALSINEQILGATHPSTATSLNNLALLYSDQGRYAEAEPLYQRALSINEQQLGTNHPNTALSLNNLAALYQDQGKYTEAEPLYQRALKIREHQLGTDHPDTAQSLNNLAGLYQTQEKYTEAEPLYQRALSIYEQQLGTDHPDTAQSLNNLAGLYWILGKYTEAEQPFQRALKIQEQQLGTNHPNTALSLNNLAALYQDQGKYTEAEPLYQRALKIREHQLGTNHPDTAQSLNNLAGLYQTQGKYTEAEPLYQRSLSIYEHQLGTNHPDTQTAQGNYAALLRAMGRKGKPSGWKRFFDFLSR